MSTVRRQAREWVVQFLYQVESNPSFTEGRSVDEMLAAFWDKRLYLLLNDSDSMMPGQSDVEDLPEATDPAEEKPIVAAAPVQNLSNNEQKARTFAEELARGVLANKDTIDVRIVDRLRNYTLDRIGAVERAVLRLGVYELAYMPAENRTPERVAINEAVDLAKFFSSSESGRFVNGILDAVARREREARGRAAAAQPRTWSPSDDSAAK